MFSRLTFFAFVCMAFPTVMRANDMTPEQKKFFEQKIRPVLIQECYGCHSAQAGNAKGGLRLDTRGSTLLGGSSGPALVPGNPSESLLYRAIDHQDLEMPPNQKLPKHVLADFRRWIEWGAPDPRVQPSAPIQSTVSQDDIELARETFWAYQPPRNVTPPTVQSKSWPRGAIDRFVLDALEKSGIGPAVDADAFSVLRRLTFDLTGLPPTPKQVSAFQRLWEKGPDQAVEHMVDDLIDSDQYGERWGRHWLDIARYAESTGREVNFTYPHAWRYRDYVIDAFNNDKPFNRFVQEQLAGDLLPVDSDEQWAENLIATTFLAMGPKKINEANASQFKSDLVDEQIDATTRVFLGLSVSCARCHDHKFDAITQQDYYALAGIFGNMKTYFGNPPSKYRFVSINERRRSSLLRLPIHDPTGKRYTKTELDALTSEIEDKMEQLRSLAMERRQAQRSEESTGMNLNRRVIQTLNQLAGLNAKLAVLDENGSPRSYCMGVQDAPNPKDLPLLVRGQIDQPADLVPRGLPQVLRDAPIVTNINSSGRLEMAQFIGSDQNPLAARVMVNRIWKHLMGRGIVASTEDFGATGQYPTHPELLDYLAIRFVRSNWSVKTIVREIATSRTYRIASEHNQYNHEFDPENQWLWRAHVKRLDAESIRDAMLQISGEMDWKRPHGSEIAEAGYTQVQAGVYGDVGGAVRDSMQRQREALRTRGSIRERFRSALRYRETLADTILELTNRLDMEADKHRSVYLSVVRDEVPRSLEVFDFADPNTVTGQRESSHTANQALFMMNNGFVIQQSEAFADRLMSESPTLRQQMDRAYQLALGRLPTNEERSVTQDFFRRFAGPSEHRATLAALCQCLFASAEFRILD